MNMVIMIIVFALGFCCGGIWGLKHAQKIYTRDK